MTFGEVSSFTHKAYKNRWRGLTKKDLSFPRYEAVFRHLVLVGIGLDVIRPIWHEPEGRGPRVSIKRIVFWDLGLSYHLLLLPPHPPRLFFPFSIRFHSVSCGKDGTVYHS